MSRFDQAIQVNASLEQCYKQLIRFDNYPNFLSGIREVRQKGDPNVWHWVIASPNGQPIQWDMELDGVKHQNNIISWHTVREADISHSGALTLKSQSERQTDVHLVVEYVSRNAGADIDKKILQWINKGLHAFKTYIENGMPISAAGLTSRSPETLDKM